MNAAEYLEQEARARRLAASVTDNSLQAQLLRLADEYAAAAAAQPDEPDPQPPMTNTQ